MSIKVIREVVGCRPKTHAGYGRIPVSLAVEFLDYNANQEAATEKCTVRKNNSEQDGKIHYERVLTNAQGVDVAKFYLKFA